MEDGVCAGRILIKKKPPITMLLRKTIFRRSTICSRTRRRRPRARRPTYKRYRCYILRTRSNLRTYSRVSTARSQSSMCFFDSRL